ncbi:glycosyltransferase [Glaciibacter flavus]|uniref:glycosyltransferase n=1 Tax=Orlajensenia flava TaxID=2565934 RepID=UPI003B0093F1
MASTARSRVPAIDRWLIARIRKDRIGQLAKSPIFDTEYYAAQVGILFSDRGTAAAHFLDEGATSGASITPLFSSEWYSYHAGESAGPLFLRFFFEDFFLSTTAPFFDARVYAAERGADAPPFESTRAALEHFLRQSDDATRMPTHELCADQPSLADARARGRASSAYSRRLAHINRDRFASTPDSPLGSDAAPTHGPTVTVVMPVRDREHVVGNAIRSVLEQRFRDWHLIIVDDGSTDGTVDSVLEAAGGDPRIVLEKTRASGVCSARNRAAARGDGELIAFLDSDNVWEPDFLARSVDLLMGSDAVAVHATVEFHDEDGRHRFLSMRGDHDDLVYGGNFIDLNTLVVRRSAYDAVGGFDERLRRWVDYDLVIRLSELGPLELLHGVGVQYDGDDNAPRISTTEAAGWEQVVLSKYLADWNAVDTKMEGRRAGLVSIVIATYADWILTLECIRSIADSTSGTDYEIVVVENGSPVSTGEILAMAIPEEGRIRLDRHYRNTNFALGSNLGFAQTEGEYVLFLNNDVVVADGAIDALAAAFVSDESVTAAQPVILASDGSVSDTGWIIESGIVRRNVRRPSPAATASIDAFSGVAVMLRARDFAEVRGFDPLYANGFDDVDLSVRLKELGGTFIVVDEAEIVHLRSYRPGRFSALSSNLRVLAALRGLRPADSERVPPADA